MATEGRQINMETSGCVPKQYFQLSWEQKMPSIFTLLSEQVKKALLIPLPHFSSCLTFPTLDISHPANQLWLALALFCFTLLRSVLWTSSICFYALRLLLSNLLISPAAKQSLPTLNVTQPPLFHSASLRLLLLFYNIGRFPLKINLIQYFNLMHFVVMFALSLNRLISLGGGEGGGDTGHRSFFLDIFEYLFYCDF